MDINNMRLKGRETKSGIDTAAAHNRRVVQATKARAVDREAHLQQHRRRANNHQFDQDAQDSDTLPLNFDTLEITPEEVLLDVPNIPFLFQTLASSNLEVVLDSVRRLRRISGINTTNNNLDITSGDRLGLITNILRRHDTSQDMTIVFEGLWTLANSATPASALSIIQANIIPELFRYLQDVRVPTQVKEQVLWLIGNIAALSVHVRDYLINENSLEILQQLAYTPMKLSLLRTLAWCMANLVRIVDKNAPPFSKVYNSALAFSTMLKFRDLEIATHAMWALSSLSTQVEGYHHEKQIGTLLTIPNLVPAIVAAVHFFKERAIMLPALLILGHIASTDDPSNGDLLFKSGAIPLILNLASGTESGLRYKAVWIISNLAVDKSHILKLMELEVFGELFQIHRSHITENRTLIEILWTISNAAASQHPEVLHAIASVGWLSALCSHLASSDQVVLKLVLETLHSFLDYGSKHQVPIQLGGQITQANIYAAIVKRINIESLLGPLVSHPVPNVAKRANLIITRFFPSETNLNSDHYLEERYGEHHSDAGAFDQDSAEGMIEMNDMNPEASYDF